MTTALLPADGHTPAGADTRVLAPGLLDAVHDHVLRLVGDLGAARAVMVDVALRTGARLEDGGPAPTLQGLLRVAHARLATEPSSTPDDELVSRLAGPMGATGRVLVRAMAIPGPRESALLDLTARHGLDLRDAADVLGIDRAAAARLHTEALRQVRAHLAESGARMDVDVPTALADLPVLPAPTDAHDLLPEGPGRSDRRGPLPRGLAWLATALVAVLTIGALAMGLPALVEYDGSIPVAQAEQVSEGPAVRRLATPDEDRSSRQVEKLVVQAPATQTTETSQTPAEQDDAATAPETDQAPTPEQPEASSPTPAPDDPEPAPDEEPTPEPSPESTNPIGDLLPTGP